MDIYPKLITNVDTSERVVALTFDDGPHPIYTPRVLDVLAKHEAKATFFMVGESARKYPAIVKRVAMEGHVIGNHTWNHPFLPHVRSRVHRLRQMWDCSRATAPFGQRLFRPPFGAQNTQVRLDAFMFRYKVIMWNVSAQDWIPQSAEEIAEKIIGRVKEGNIFLLHDAMVGSKVPEEPGGRDSMVEGLEKALIVLDRKIRFVTIPEILSVGRPVFKWPLNAE